MLKVGDKVRLPAHGECTIKTIFNNSYLKEEHPTIVLKPEHAKFSLHRVVLPLKEVERLNKNKAKRP